MKQRQVIFRFLFPTRQNAAKAVHPAMGPFHNPTASLETGLVLDRLGFFATRTNMSSIAKRLYQITDLTRVIPFIKTHTLFFSFCWRWPFYGNTFYRRLCHFAIMPIGSVNGQANRDTAGLGQQTTFNAFFSSVCRVWACFFPHPAELWSWRHPSIATTSQSLSTHHNPPASSSKVSEKHRPGSTPEIVSEPCCWNKCRFHSERSIDSRFSRQKEHRPLPDDPALSVCRRQSDVYSDVSVSMARFFPITRLKSCIDSWFSVFSSLNPFKGIVAFEYIGYSGVFRIGS